METIGDRFRIAREATGLTQDGMAEALKQVDPSLNPTRMNISHLENNVISSMKDRLLMASCKLLCCSPEWLVYGDGEPVFEKVEPEQEGDSPTEVSVITSNQPLSLHVWRSIEAKAKAVADSIEHEGLYLHSRNLARVNDTEAFNLNTLVSMLYEEESLT
ncbi:hypothetical protein CSW98_01370 [Vibrio sp. HA2012]|uniref:helix-turn-helix domain-containing protein n=1 Tax=Vibrio sp. HA2012 TaxID=1971595 RepID=UPI000C2C2578|nr:hypothetical protein [Vibrio sp. HA2012]PJC87805.1 hypothetical protein CSW98_01370 [Vibrio sp. HA2012]